MKLAKTARNAAVAEIAIAFARDRLAAQLPGVKPRKRRPGKKSLVIGGVAVTAAAALLLKRDKVVALLPGRSDEPAPPEPGYTPPPVSNYDAAGPVANTATAVPVPPAQESPAIDEAEEEAAAAAEAANIGGTVSDYAGPDGEYATDAEAPLAEAGEGESEGEEQADLELREAAEDDEDGQSPEEAQIDEAIEDAGNPLAGEQADPARPGGDSEWRTWSGRSEP